MAKNPPHHRPRRSSASPPPPAALTGAMPASAPPAASRSRYSASESPEPSQNAAPLLRHRPAERLRGTSPRRARHIRPIHQSAVGTDHPGAYPRSPHSPPITTRLTPRGRGAPPPIANRRPRPAPTLAITVLRTAGPHAEPLLPQSGEASEAACAINGMHQPTVDAPSVSVRRKGVTIWAADTLMTTTRTSHGAQPAHKPTPPRNLPLPPGPEATPESASSNTRSG